MRSQIYVILKQAFNQDTDHKNWPIMAASGMLSGFIINCETDDELMKSLEWLARYGHYAEVKMLSESDPWPTRDQWITEVTNGQQVLS